MTATGLRGPFELSFEAVTGVVKPHSRGVFALGESRGPERFLISYVGAGYADVRHDLLARIGTAPMFKFGISQSAEVAFLEQCDLFHRFRPNGNFVHPERPPGSRLACPHCNSVMLTDRRGPVRDR